MSRCQHAAIFRARQEENAAKSERQQICDPSQISGVLEKHKANKMISFWHLSAVCCVPKLNPERRVREQEIFAEVAKDAARRVPKGAKTLVRGRWELRELAMAGTE